MHKLNDMNIVENEEEDKNEEKSLDIQTLITSSSGEEKNENEFDDYGNDYEEESTVSNQETPSIEKDSIRNFLSSYDEINEVEPLSFSEEELNDTISSSESKIDNKSIKMKLEREQIIKNICAGIEHLFLEEKSNSSSGDNSFWESEE